MAPSAFIRATASRTRCTTSIVRSNFCISTMPVTMSVVPSRPAMPSRGVKPICILATSEISTGRPPSWVSTILPMSSSDLTMPTPRTLTACSPIAIVRRQVGLAQAIYCLLGHEVVVAAIFELQPNETQRIDRVGADESEPGRTGDRDLYRDRDVTFHLLGRLPWPLRDDLDDRGRGIGIGLDVERGEGYKAQPEKRPERDQHERATQ